MIIFDTNVVSEIMKPDADPSVNRWLLSCAGVPAATTAINEVELRAGAARLPSGKRKTVLLEQIEETLKELFHGRIIPFDSGAAKEFSKIAESMRQRGRAIGFADCQIAAIAALHDYQVATRDVRPFKDSGVRAVNPWENPIGR